MLKKSAIFVKLIFDLIYIFAYISETVQSISYYHTSSERSDHKVKNVVQFIDVLIILLTEY